MCHHRLPISALLQVLIPAVALAGSTASETPSTARRPNILFIFTDDQPQTCFGALGNKHIQTPNLDRLAADGVLFSNAFVTTAICCSNRACILTGQHMRRHGIEDFRKPLSAEAMAQTYPVLLRSDGYRTGFLGKFAVGRDDPEIEHLSLPRHQFDFWYGFPQSINFLQEKEGEPRYLTTRMEEEAVEFLQTQSHDQPFCLTVAIKEPHGPWNFFDPDVPDEYETVRIPPPATFTRAHYQALPEFIQQSLGGRGAEQRFENPESLQQRARTFYRLITRADIALGRLREALKQTGFDQNTVIIYSSDHGSMMGAHGLSGKWLMYEESIRIPLVIFDPRLSSGARGRRRDEMVLSIDLAPTMLALADTETPAAIQGRNLMPLVEGQSVAWREDWYYEHTYANPPVHPIPKSEGVRTEHWKYVRYTDFEPPYEQLFHLQNDPLEEHDLARDPRHAGILNELQQRCDESRRELE